MANGLSTFFAFAIAQPVRARALMRLIPGVVDPDMPINAGIRGDVTLGVKTKRFVGPSRSIAAVVALHRHRAGPPQCVLTDAAHRVADAVRLRQRGADAAWSRCGLKQTRGRARRKTAIESRRKELKP